MAKTRTLFAALVAVLGFAETATAQSITVTASGYEAPMPPYRPAKTGPGGTFNPDPSDMPYLPHRVRVTYGTRTGNPLTFTAYNSTAQGYVGSHFSQEYNSPTAGQSWSVQWKAEWPTNAPPSSNSVAQCCLEKKVNGNWVLVATEYRDAKP